jgi:uncharacterized protein
MLNASEKVVTISTRLKNKFGERINADFRYSRDSETKNPVLIFCHGLKGFKDWGCFPYILESVAEEEMFTVSFNFSYNGVGFTGQDEQEFKHLDLFAKNTISRELDDLESVIEFLFQEQGKYNYDLTRIYLMGHSRGGGVAIIKTAENRKIKKLITLASVSTFDRYTERAKKLWKEKGYIETLNSRTNQLMRFNYTYLQDIEKNKRRFDLPKAMSKIKVPVLIIHGAMDVSVDFSESQVLYNHSNKNLSRLEIYENTNHTFGAEHPFKATSPTIETLINNIINFLKY